MPACSESILHRFARRGMVTALFASLTRSFRSRAALQLEILALRPNLVALMTVCSAFMDAGSQQACTTRSAPCGVFNSNHSGRRQNHLNASASPVASPSKASRKARCCYP